LCSVQAFHILFHILLHVCMSVDFASVKVVIKESYYYYYYYTHTDARNQYTCRVVYDSREM